MAAQASGGFKTLLSMGFAKPYSPGTVARRFKVDLEETSRRMRATEAAKATSKALQEKPRRRPGRPRKSLTVSNVLGIGAGSETDNVVATSLSLILNQRMVREVTPLSWTGKIRTVSLGWRIQRLKLGEVVKMAQLGGGDKDGPRQSGAKSDEPPQKKVPR
ncbi:unnamed protein product [Sphagnum balticum]